MPILQKDFFRIQKLQQNKLLLSLLRKSKRLVEKLFSEWKRKKMSNKRFERSKESSVERWTNLSETKGKVCRPINKICLLSKRIFKYGKERWICNGTQIKSSDRNWKTTFKNRMCPSYKSQSRRQQNRKSNVIQNESGTQEIRMEAGYKTTLATITPIKYTGLIFCPTVSTGAFVARRNGKIFITGNSGFPKSLNIGKAVDKTIGKCLYFEEFRNKIRRNYIK